jgi:DNA adenine methylase
MSIIKWAGGKKHILPLFKVLYDIAKPKRVIDLFCGSLTIPLSLNCEEFILNDINTGLIALYKNSKNNLNELCKECDLLNNPFNNNKELFNKLRTLYNKEKRDSIKSSAIFLYLNKRSFNGLYRENGKGEYNVPYRKYNTDIYDMENLKFLNKFLNERKVQIYNMDYKKLNIDYDKSDLVYLDPPYFKSSESKFTSYNKEQFSEKEQKELFDFCDMLDKKGVKFILSNSPCDEIKKLYQKFNQFEFYIPRSMRSGKGKSEVCSNRNKPNEILIWNFCKINLENRQLI